MLFEPEHKPNAVHVPRWPIRFDSTRLLGLCVRDWEGKDVGVWGEGSGGKQRAEREAERTATVERFLPMPPRTNTV